jgi:hypothetical protein
METFGKQEKRCKTDDGIFRFLLRNPRALFALAVILFMC